MKTKISLSGMFLLSVLAFTSCTSESDAAIKTDEAASTQTMDNNIDHISVIVANQYKISEDPLTGKAPSTDKTSRECDNLAMLSIDDGTAVQITL